MKTMLVVVLIANGVFLLSAIPTYLTHRRTETPIPSYFVGSVAANIGILLMLAAVSGRLDEKVAGALLILASLLTTWSAAIAFRARRQLPKVSRKQ